MLSELISSLPTRASFSDEYRSGKVTQPPVSTARKATAANRAACGVSIMVNTTHPP